MYFWKEKESSSWEGKSEYLEKKTGGENDKRL